MYKLKYSLLLPIVMMYAANACAMTSRTTQLGRRAATSAPRLAPAAARPFATSTARVVPTWQQAPATQQAQSGVKPFAADSSNRSLVAAQASRQSGSGRSTFWERYNKYGLTAAIAGWWAKDQQEDKFDIAKQKRAGEEKIAELVIKENEAYAKTLIPCQKYPDLKRILWHEARELLPKMESESPECVTPYNDYLSAQIETLQEENRQVGNHWDKDFADRKRTGNLIRIDQLRGKQRWLSGLITPE